MKHILLAFSTLFMFSAPACGKTAEQTSAGGTPKAGASKPGTQKPGGEAKGSKSLPGAESIVPTGGPPFQIDVGGKNLSGMVIGPDTIALQAPIENGVVTVFFESSVPLDSKLIQGHDLIVGKEGGAVAMPGREGVTLPIGPKGGTLTRVAVQGFFDGETFACNGLDVACEDIVVKLDEDLIRRLLDFKWEETKVHKGCDVSCTDNENRCAKVLKVLSASASDPKDLPGTNFECGDARVEGERCCYWTREEP